MKTKNLRFISLLLVLAIIFSTLPAVAMNFDFGTENDAAITHSSGEQYTFADGEESKIKGSTYYVGDTLNFYVSKIPDKLGIELRICGNKVDSAISDESVELLSYTLSVEDYDYEYNYLIEGEPYKIKDIFLYSDSVMGINFIKAPQVAQIVESQNVYYSIQDAIDDTVDGQTVKLTSDVTEDITISQNKTVILDLNGHILTGFGNDSVIKNEGDLTIIDSDNDHVYYYSYQSMGNGEGYWLFSGDDSRMSEYAVSYNELPEEPSDVFLYITGGAVTYNYGSRNCVIKNDGTLTITSGVIIGGASDEAGGIYQNGTLNLGGSAIVVGNAGGNVLLNDGKTISFCNGADAPTQNMIVGISTKEVGSYSSNVQIASSGSEIYSDCIFSDAFGYEVYTGNNKLEFKVKDNCEWYLNNRKSGVFEISNTAELEVLADIVRTGHNNFGGRTLKLTDSFNNANPLTTPIGTGDNYFSGFFDGNGKTINLNMSENGDGVGLFGSLDGYVCNLTVSGTVIGSSTVGAIAAINEWGTIYNCNVINCNITGKAISGGNIGGLVGENYSGNIRNCTFSDGTVYGGHGVGGIVGFNSYGNISNVYCDNSNIEGYKNVGGIVGYNTQGKIYSSENSSEVYGEKSIGGIAGYNDYVIQYSYNKGPVTGKKVLETSQEAGGICGILESDGYADISNCHSTGNIFAGSHVGGIVGFIRTGNAVTKIYNCY